MRVEARDCYAAEVLKRPSGDRGDPIGMVPHPKLLTRPLMRRGRAAADTPRARRACASGGA